MTESPAPRSRRAPELRRQAVLDAARELFTGAGVEATSIDRIAAHAEVAKGTVYLYFPSKSHIVAALESEYSDGLIARIRQLAETSDGVTADAWCGSLVVAYLETLELHDALFYGRTVASRSAVADNALIDDLATVIRSSNPQDDRDSDTVAAFLVGGVTTMIDRLILRAEGTKIEAPEAAEAARALARGALARTAPAQVSRVISTLTNSSERNGPA